MKIKVEITADDIAKGSRNVCTMCPVSRALNRAVGNEEITPQTASRWKAQAQPSRLFADGRRRIMCDTPEDVRVRILAWDATGQMEPFSFQVDETTEAATFQRVFPGLYMPAPLPKAS